MHNILSLISSWRLHDMNCGATSAPLQLCSLSAVICHENWTNLLAVFLSRTMFRCILFARLWLAIAAAAFVFR